MHKNTGNANAVKEQSGTRQYKNRILHASRMQYMQHRIKKSTKAKKVKLL